MSEGMNGMKLFAERLITCQVLNHILEGAMGWPRMNGLYVFMTSTYTHKKQNTRCEKYLMIKNICILLPRIGDGSPRCQYDI
jgi:hypothetical protein